MFRPFEGTVGRMSNDVIVPRHGRQVQAHREYECDVQEHRWYRWAMHCGTNPRCALSPEEFKIPVLHVRQVAKCLGFMPQGAAGVTSAPKDLHDSAVWVLGCSVSSPEGWGERTEGGRDGSIFISIGHHCCGERRNRTDGKSGSLTDPGKLHRGDTNALLCRANLPAVDAL